MKKTYISVIIAILLLTCTSPIAIDALSASPEFTVIIDDGMNTVKGNEPAVRTYNLGLELWHHSGGYWSIGDEIKIYDRELNNDLLNAEELAKRIGQYEFRINIDHDLKELLDTHEKINLLISTSRPDLTLDNLFYNPETISLNLADDALLLKVKPKIYFYNDISFNELIGKRLSINLPVVDPKYGENRYAIWRRQNPISWGATSSHFDKDDPFAPAPEGSGKIAPSQIINNQGHLADGFTFESVSGGERTTRNSSEASVGSGTLDGGGAVSIRFIYPLKLTFYAALQEDLSVSFSPHISSAVTGNMVTVGAVITSTFEEDLDHVPFKWTITDSSGKPVEPVTYTGHATTHEGQTAISAEKNVQIHYASFTMPDDQVTVAFEVNPDGTSPEESYLDNNRVETTIRPAAILSSTSDFELDYHILSRDVEFDLAESPITATLSLPGWTNNRWNGSATGQLNVANDSPDLLRNFQVHNNPAVNEPLEVIQREPVISSTLRREDFGDDPGRGVYHPGPNEERGGLINFGGTVERPFVYTVQNCDDKTVIDPETGEQRQERVCHDEDRYDTAKAEFSEGPKTVNVRARIYNGMAVIPPQLFDNRIDPNTRSDLKKSLWWESEPYAIDVIRWMYHMDVNENLTSPRAIDGQYQREFVQQNRGVVHWEIASSMASKYDPNREAARDRRYDRSAYDYAVFASDRDVRNVDYPIKSGYYFNPAGEYTFTIETVTYKPTTADTQDHKELVEAVIRAFRYESDLIYINSNKEAVNLQNERLPREGNSYRREAASLTADDPTGVDDQVLLRVLDRNDSESRYEKLVEELEHAPDANGYTHPYWKQIMEGHAESGTESSYSNYKYAEYVKSGQHMYRITERTTVTIQINPDNIPVYTHAHMPDGSYTVRAWIDDVDLSALSPEYRKLGTLRGIRDLDRIEITVKGSMYDDIE